MNILTKAYHYTKWMIDELFSKDNPMDVYNKIATNGVYDKVVDYEKRVSQFKKALAHLQQKPKHVLDLATGTGAMIDALHQITSASLVGIDISEKMLEQAKKRFKKSSRVSFLHGDSFNTNFPKNTLDLITIGFATRFIPKDKEEQFVKNAANWLKKEGNLLIVNMDSPQRKLKEIVAKTIGIPRKQNVFMESEEYLVNKLKPYFTHEKTVHLGSRYVIFNSKALLFKRK